MKAIIQKLEGRGRNRYAVTFPQGNAGNGTGVKEGDSVTFSIAAWRGSTPPKRNQVVRLETIQEFKGGWRAEEAHPIEA
jgi:hypothetical protein